MVLFRLIWTWPKWIGSDQNDWFLTKMIWTVQNHFGPIEGFCWITKLNKVFLKKFPNVIVYFGSLWLCHTALHSFDIRSCFRHFYHLHFNCVFLCITFPIMFFFSILLFIGCKLLFNYFNWLTWINFNVFTEEFFHVFKYSK